MQLLAVRRNMAETYCVFLGEASAIDYLSNLNGAVMAFDYCPGIKIVPYTSELHLALCEEYEENPPGGDVEGTESLNGAIASLVSEASKKGKIAYIFEEHFGGCRDCDSILWDSGRISFGPSIKHGDQKKVLEQMSIDKESRYKFTKYEHPDEWLNEKNC